MGGDFGPPVVIPASLLALAKHNELNLILVGDREVLQKELSSHKSYDQSRLTIQHASQKVEMDEPPSHALRSKKDSSMRVAINLVKEGKAQAAVSAGNTGALMATARFVLKTIPGIDRPAIISSFPTESGKKMRMLDLGANVDSTAENLFQFALMGSLLASAVDNIKNPSVYLLNIGKEDIKGDELVKKTSQLLANSNVLNYAGYIEADELAHGKADIVVCDGFVGNVALKATEGVASFISKLLKNGFNRNFLTKIAGLIALPILKSVSKRIDPAQYNGASFIGLQGIVIKSHGGAKTLAFANALEEAIIEVEKNIPEKIGAELEELLKLSSQTTENKSSDNVNDSQ